MRKLPKLIQVESTPQAARILVDGQVFPWAIDPGCVEFTIGGPDEIPSVTITMLAERVEATHALDPRPGPQPQP